MDSEEYNLKTSLPFNWDDCACRFGKTSGTYCVVGDSVFIPIYKFMADSLRRAVWQFESALVVLFVCTVVLLIGPGVLFQNMTLVTVTVGLRFVRLTPGPRPKVHMFWVSARLSLEFEISKSASFTVGGLTLETRIYFADGYKKETWKERKKERQKERKMPTCSSRVAWLFLLSFSESESVTVMLHKFR